MLCRAVCNRNIGSNQANVSHQAVISPRVSRVVLGGVFDQRSHKSSSAAIPYDSLYLVAEAASSSPGDVVAPQGALLIPAVLVTVASIVLIPLLLKPGTDAAADMQKRDQKSGRWRE